MSCSSCIWFSGDPVTDYGWCYTEEQPTNKDHNCDFWQARIRTEYIWGPFCWLKQYEPNDDEGEYE